MLPRLELLIGDVIISEIEDAIIPARHLNYVALQSIIVRVALFYFVHNSFSKEIIAGICITTEHFEWQALF